MIRKIIFFFVVWVVITVRIKSDYLILIIFKKFDNVEVLNEME